jgi:hypothetical protein
MGFLSKLRKLTGGWADVEVQATPAQPGGTTTVTATIAVKDEPIAIDGVHLEIQRRDLQPSTDSTGAVTNHWVAVHHERRTVSGAAEIPAGTHGTFSHDFTIPFGSPPSGRFAVEWRARAVVEMDGNDPDSGWQDFPVG